MGGETVMNHHPEQIEQEKVVRWLTLQYSKALFTASVQEHSGNIQRAIRRNRMGYRKGTPDLALYEIRGGKAGLFIEMKAIEGGRLSPEQAVFLAELESRGYATLVCHGAQQAIDGITKYMEVKS
jgi:hypothetical protein